MAETTRGELVKELSYSLFPMDWVDGACVSSGELSVEVLVLEEIRDADASSDLYDGGYAYVYEGPNAGEWRRIVEYNPSASGSYGTVRLSRPLPTLPVAGLTKVVLYNGGATPQDLRKAINESLGRLYTEDNIPLTILEDGDMEEDNTDAWVGNNVTLSKVESGVFEGHRSLRVANTLANGYAESVPISVAPGEALRCEVVSKIIAGTYARAELVDQSNNVLTYTSTDFRVPSRHTLSLPSIPAGVYQIFVRLLGVSPSSVVEWDDAIVWKPRHTQLTLPDRVLDRTDIMNVYRRKSKAGTGVNNIVEPFNVDYVRVPNWETIYDPFGDNHVTLDLARAGGLSWWPVIIQVHVAQEELSSDTSVTHANKRDVLAKARATVYEKLQRAGPGRDRRYYRQQAEDARGNVNFGVSPYQPRGRGPAARGRR